MTRQRLRVFSLQLPNSSLKGLQAGNESARRRFCNFDERRRRSLPAMLNSRGKSNLAPLWATKMTFFCFCIDKHHLDVGLDQTYFTSCLKSHLKKSPRTTAASPSASRSRPRRTKWPSSTFIPCTIVAPQWIGAVGTMNLQ